MSNLKDWVIDKQENGDDGSGFLDYPPLCGDCLYPLSQCEHGREFRG